MNAALQTPPPPVPEPVQPMSEGARLANVFFAPTKTFTDLRRKSSWWAPYILISLVSILFVYTVEQKIGFRKVVENQIQMSPKASQQMEQLPADQREQRVESQAKVTRYISYCFFVIILIWYVVVAAILLGTFKLGFGADLTFGKTMAVVVYSSVPGILKSILAIISILAGMAPDSFSMQNPVATNPGYFLSPAESPVLFAMLSSIDIFIIWTLILAAIGLTCVSKLKRTSAYIGIFGWYAILTAIGMAFAAIR